MLSHGEDKPPSRRMKRYWKVAVLANIKDEVKTEARRSATGRICRF